MAHDFVRVPPDSTGKKVRHHRFLDGEGVEYYQPFVSISDVDNPDNGMRVDNKGQAYMRYAEGAQVFDAYGTSKVSNQRTLGEYYPFYDTLPNDMCDQITGNASVVKNPNRPSVMLQVGTAAGDKVVRTTNKYHTVLMGNGQICSMSGLLGDTGKTNVRRRWGYFDERDGLFFEMDATVLYVVSRSYATGVPADTRIPQAAWNGDPLDGSGTSGMILHVDRSTTVWMDIQHTGGKIRFGVLDETGNRVVCHTLTNVNSGTTGLATSFNLPLRWEIENVGESISPSVMRCGPAYVATEGYRDLWGKMFAAVPPDEVAVTGAAFTPIWSMKMAETFYGAPNRVAAIPSLLNISVTGDPVILMIVKNATLTDAAWNIPVDDESGVIGDMSATAYTGGTVVATMIANANTAENLNLSDFFDYRGEYLRLQACGTISDTYTLVAKTTKAAGNSQLYSAMTWWEIR